MSATSRRETDAAVGRVVRGYPGKPLLLALAGAPAAEGAAVAVGLALLGPTWLKALWAGELPLAGVARMARDLAFACPVYGGHTECAVQMRHAWLKRPGPLGVFEQGQLRLSSGPAGLQYHPPRGRVLALSAFELCGVTVGRDADWARRWVQLERRQGEPLLVARDVDLKAPLSPPGPASMRWALALGRHLAGGFGLPLVAPAD